MNNTQREAIYGEFRTHPYFEGVDPKVAKMMHDEILDAIIKKGAEAARTEEDKFTPAHWNAVAKKMSRKLTALKFCFECLRAAPAPQINKEEDVDEYAEFKNLA